MLRIVDPGVALILFFLVLPGLVASAAINHGQAEPLRTASIRVNFLRPFFAGAQSRYEGTALRVGRNSAIGDAQAVGALLAFKDSDAVAPKKSSLWGSKNTWGAWAPYWTLADGAAVVAELQHRGRARLDAELVFARDLARGDDLLERHLEHTCRVLRILQVPKSNIVLAVVLAFAVYAIWYWMMPKPAPMASAPIRSWSASVISSCP